MRVSVGHLSKHFHFKELGLRLGGDLRNCRVKMHLAFGLLDIAITLPLE